MHLIIEKKPPRGVDGIIQGFDISINWDKTTITTATITTVSKLLRHHVNAKLKRLVKIEDLILLASLNWIYYFSEINPNCSYYIKWSKCQTI